MYIPCDEVTLRTFGLKLDAVVRAHLAAKEVEDMLAKRAEERARAKSKKVA